MTAPCTSASLEATPRHKGRTAPLPNRSPYEGIECPSLFHKCLGQAASDRHSHSSCDRSPSITSGHCSAIPDTVEPAARDKIGSALFPSLFCQLRPSGLYLIIRMAPGPPPARERVRCRHGPLEEGCPSPVAGVPDPPSRGPGPPRVSQTSWCARLHSVQGVQDRRVPRHHWSTQDPDLQGPLNTTSGVLYALQ